VKYNFYDIIYSLILVSISSKGNLPVISVNVITPIDHKSHFSEYSPFITSGAILNIEPVVVLSVSFFDRKTELPKSANFIYSPSSVLVYRIFSSFKSLRKIIRIKNKFTGVQYFCYDNKLWL
jgi:hypothetical protein